MCLVRITRPSDGIKLLNIGVDNKACTGARVRKSPDDDTLTFHLLRRRGSTSSYMLFPVIRVKGVISATRACNDVRKRIYEHKYRVLCSGVVTVVHFAGASTITHIILLGG